MDGNVIYLENNVFSQERTDTPERQGIFRALRRKTDLPEELIEMLAGVFEITYRVDMGRKEETVSFTNWLNRKTFNDVMLGVLDACYDARMKTYEDGLDFKKSA